MGAHPYGVFFHGMKGLNHPMMMVGVIVLFSIISLVGLQRVLGSEALPLTLWVGGFDRFKRGLIKDSSLSQAHFISLMR